MSDSSLWPSLNGRARLFCDYINADTDEEAVEAMCQAMRDEGSAPSEALVLAGSASIQGEIVDVTQMKREKS